MRPVRPSRLALLGAVAWAALLFLSSSGTGVSWILSRLPPGSDKFVHAAAYFVLGALLALGTGRPRLAFWLAVAYGVSDEVHQAFVPGRYPDALDLVADAVGAGLGCWLVWNVHKRPRSTPVE